MARGSEYTDEIGDAVCALIAEGKSVREIGEMKGLPAQPTIYKWLAAHPSFVEKYTRAREQQADVYSQEIVDIADNATPEDYMVAKLRMDGRKWAASKLAPKKYGDKVQSELSGPGGGPIQMQPVEMTFVRPAAKATDG